MFLHTATEFKIDDILPLALTHTYRQNEINNRAFGFAYTTDGTDAITRTDVTDPRLNVERVDYNAAGYIVSNTKALGTAVAQTTTYEYEAGTNQLLASVDPLGRRTEFTYDTMGNVLTVKRLAGTVDAVTETMTYTSDFNQLATYKNPLNYQTTYAYDTAGRLTSITDPLNHITQFQYNEFGQVTRVIDPRNQPTDFGYSIFDLQSITDPIGRTATFTTDVLGRQIIATDPMGNRTRFAYDALSRLTQVTDAQGQLTTTTYDGNSNLLTLTDARSGLTQFAYDTKNRLATRTDPLLKAETFEYDKADNLTKHTDRKLQITQYSYDALNRRSVTIYHDASTTTNTWDAGNRITQLVDTVSGTITRTFDGLDRLTQETTPQGTVSRTYDDASRPATMTVTGQTAVSYTFDNADRLTQITRGSDVVSLTYDNADRRATLTLPNAVVITYGFDNANQLTSLTYARSGVTLGDLTYSYDLAGRRVGVGGSYAAANLPTAVATTVYNAANRLTNWNGTTLTYDDNGNVLNDGARTYTWDVRNQLSSISGGATGSFVYDAVGRRISKTISGTTTKFLYDGLNAVQTQNAAGTPTAQMLAGLNLDEWLARIDATGTTSVLPDALGSTVKLTNSTGTVTAGYTYEPYGKATKTGTDDTAFRFTGREDDGTGLYYYRARYYSPQFGRFVAEDPIGIAGGPNAYAYVGGNPISGVDPRGLFGVFGMSATTNAFQRGTTLREATAQGEIGISNAYIASPAVIPIVVGAVGPGAVGATEIAGPAVVATGKAIWNIADIAGQIMGLIGPVLGMPPSVSDRIPEIPQEADPKPHIQKAAQSSRLPKLSRIGKVIPFLGILPFFFPDDPSCP